MCWHAWWICIADLTGVTVSDTVSRVMEPSRKYLWGKFWCIILVKAKQSYWNHCGLSLKSRELYLAVFLPTPNTMQTTTLQGYSANVFLHFSIMMLTIFAFLTCVQSFLCTAGVVYWILRLFCDKKLVVIRWTFPRFPLKTIKKIVYFSKRERRTGIYERFFSNLRWKTLPVQHPEFVGMCMMSSQLEWVGLLHMVSETKPSHLPKRYHRVVK